GLDSSGTQQRHHERGNKHGQDGDEGVVGQLRQPCLEEPFGGVEEQERDEQRPQRQEDRERDLGEGEQEYRVNGGKTNEDVDGEGGEVVAHAVEDPALLIQLLGHAIAVDDDFIDDGDGLKSTD